MKRNITLLGEQAPASQSLATCHKPQPMSRFPKYCSRPQVQAKATVQKAGQHAKTRLPGADEMHFSAKLAEWAVSTPAVFNILKRGAMSYYKASAKQLGIDWEGHCQMMQAQMHELEDIKQEIEDPHMLYPDYYLQPFHGYDTGNLSWQAAIEVEPATLVTAAHLYKKQLPPKVASNKMRQAALSALRAYMSQHHLPSPGHILDVGCSTGISTEALAEAFPSASITGIDLSPYFLSVAVRKQRSGIKTGRFSTRVKYRHSRAEDTGLQSGSQDLVAVSFVLHECPQSAIQAILSEAKRVLKKGGMLMVVDVDYQAPAVREMHPALQILARSTEPWMDTQVDFGGQMAAAGFNNLHIASVTPRHIAAFGQP